MTVKALDLFQAYGQNKLPGEGGYIVSSFLNESTRYSKYAIVCYGGARKVLLSDEGLTFQTDGNKLFVICEPPGYPHKSLEPYKRESHEHVPHHFSELEVVTSKNKVRVLVGKEPVSTYGSFTVARPGGIDFCFFFFNLKDVLSTIRSFFAATLSKEAGVPADDASKASLLIEKGLKKFTIWKDVCVK